MTHIFILVDPDTITMKKSDLTPNKVMEQIYEGELRLPEELETPRCFNLDDYVFVIGRKPMPDISDIQEKILEKLALGAKMTQIAKVMGYSYENIRYHVDELKKKFNVETWQELAVVYRRNNPHLF